MRRTSITALYCLPKRAEILFEHGIDVSAAPTGPVRKKKRHTLKPQGVIDYETSTILGIAQGQGPTSDLKLFEQSSVHLAAEVWYLADGGYRGLDALHPQTVPLYLSANPEAAA